MFRTYMPRIRPCVSNDRTPTGLSRHTHHTQAHTLPHTITHSSAAVKAEETEADDVCTLGV